MSNEKLRPNREIFEVAHLEVRPINITLTGSIVVKGILLPDNKIFVPINSKSDNPILEEMKSKNRSAIGAEFSLRPVDDLKDKLNVPQTCNTKGCWTEMISRFHSSGIEFELDHGEILNTESLFDNLHQSFPHLTFSMGKLD